MAVAKVPADLPQIVKAAFSKARHNGDLLYFETQVTILSLSSHPVRLSAPATLLRRDEKKPLLIHPLRLAPGPTPLLALAGQQAHKPGSRGVTD